MIDARNLQEARKWSPRFLVRSMAQYKLGHSSWANAVMMPGAVLTTIHRRGGSKILSTLIRHFRNFNRPKEALHNAYNKALTRWRVDKLPDQPAAWLPTVAERHALNVLRRVAKIAINSEEIIDTLEAAVLTPDVDETIHKNNIASRQLRRIFTGCFSARTQPAQAALAPITLCKLSARAIVHAINVAEIAYFKRRLAETSNVN